MSAELGRREFSPAKNLFREGKKSFFIVLRADFITKVVDFIVKAADFIIKVVSFDTKVADFIVKVSFKDDKVILPDDK